MDDALHVAVGDARQHLVQELLDLQRLHGLGAEPLHVRAQVLVEVLEDEVELLLVDDHVLEAASGEDYVTTFLWSISRSSEISRIEVLGKPSFSMSRITFFIATTSRVLASMHRYT